MVHYLIQSTLDYLMEKKFYWVNNYANFKNDQLLIRL